jgi:hypothetical protein
VFSVCTLPVFLNLDIKGKLIILRFLTCVTKQNLRAAKFALLYYLNPDKNGRRVYLISYGYTTIMFI